MLKIEKLAKAHHRKFFDCGSESLNRFIQNQARQQADRGLSRTFVLIEDSHPKTIMGYFTLTICEVIPDDIPDPRLQRYPHPMPAAKLARLAIALKHQKQGRGKILMIEALRRTMAISEQAGLIGIFVDAKDEWAAAYYQQYQFIPHKNNPLLLFLPIGTIGLLFK